MNVMKLLRPRWQLCFCIFVLTAIPSASFSGISVKTVALTGQTPEGVDPSLVFTGFTNPVIDAGGRVAFVAGLGVSGGPVNTTTGIWTTDLNGVLQLVALSGQTAPGTEPGVMFAGFDIPAVNAYGQTSFYAGLTGPSVGSGNNLGLWTNSSGSLELIARKGYGLSGLSPGITVADLVDTDTPQINNLGQTAIRTVYAGPGITADNDSATHLHSSGILLQIAREGEHPPGTAPDVKYLYPSVPNVNNYGEYIFRSGITGPGIPAPFIFGLWTNVSGPLELIAQAGQAAIDQPVGVTYDGLYGQVINDSGQIVFQSNLDGTGITFENDTALYQHVQGVTSLLLQAGDTADDAGAGVSFYSFGPPVLSDNAVIGLNATLTGSGVNSLNSESLWIIRDGVMDMVVRQKEPAPGAAPGVVIRSVFNPMVNKLGQMAAFGYLEGPGVDSTNDKAIWITNENHDLVQVVRKGDMFDVNDDPLVEDLRLITDLSIRDIDPEQYPSLNDNGHLSFLLKFSDGSIGLFMASTWLPGDLSGDGFVGIADLNAVLSNWNQNVTPGDPLLGDASGDGFVGITDLNGVLGNWNTGTPPAPVDDTAVIPEPGVLGMMIGLGVLCRGRKRHRPTA